MNLKYLRNHFDNFRLGTNVSVRHASDEHRLFEPRTDCKLGERAFKYIAPRLYNKLPTEMKSIQEEQQFKKQLKSLIFSRCYDLEDNTTYSDYKL